MMIKQGTLEKITASGLKCTHQRIEIYEAVSESNTHPTAEDVFSFLKDRNPTLSLATVYKTLDTFVEVGLIKRVATPSGKKRYDASLDQHNHIFCTNTSEIVDFYDEELNRVIVDYLQKKKIKNLTIKDIRLQINGEKVDPSATVTIE